MKVQIIVYRNDSLMNPEPLYQAEVEGNSFFTAGYILAIEERYPNNSVVTIPIEEDEKGV